MGALGWIFGGFGIFVLLFYGLFFGLVFPKIRKTQRENKEAKHRRELEKAQVMADIEIKKSMAAYEAKPRFCPYCGTKHSAGQSNCKNCGGALD